MKETFDKIQEEVQQRTGVSISRDAFEQFYTRLIEYYLTDRTKKNVSTYSIGLTGGQGTGKSVLATVMKAYFQIKGFSVGICSIDDFYLSYQERKKLTETGNPFYQHRGLPGTHHVALLVETLQKAKNGQQFTLPVFNKSLHDGKGDISSETRNISNRLDFFILEGWCVGIPLFSKKEFLTIIKRNDIVSSLVNELDPNHQHINVVLDHLSTYQSAWKHLDTVTMIRSDISFITQWRQEQEEQLRKTKGHGMSNEKIAAFVKPFIPFTYVMYETMKADCILSVGKGHTPEKIEIQ